MNKTKQVGICIDKIGNMRKFNFNKETPTGGFLNFELNQLQFNIDDHRTRIHTKKLMFLKLHNTDTIQLTFTNQKKILLDVSKIRNSKTYKSMLDGEVIKTVSAA